MAFEGHKYCLGKVTIDRHYYRRQKIRPLSTARDKWSLPFSRQQCLRRRRKSCPTQPSLRTHANGFLDPASPIVIEVDWFCVMPSSSLKRTRTTCVMQRRRTCRTAKAIARNSCRSRDVKSFRVLTVARTHASSHAVVEVADSCKHLLAGTPKPASNSHRVALSRQNHTSKYASCRSMRITGTNGFSSLVRVLAVGARRTTYPTLLVIAPDGSHTVPRRGFPFVRSNWSR